MLFITYCQHLVLGLFHDMRFLTTLYSQEKGSPQNHLYGDLKLLRADAGQAHIDGKDKLTRGSPWTISNNLPKSF